jgi:hypothetical protein
MALADFTFVILASFPERRLTNYEVTVAAGPI